MPTPSPKLDSLIARSKQVTADLMTVRREASRLSNAGTSERRVVDSVRSRISLVVDELQSMSSELWEMWEQSSPYRDWSDPVAPKTARASNLKQPRLVANQLRLTGGDN